MFDPLKDQLAVFLVTLLLFSFLKKKKHMRSYLCMYVHAFRTQSPLAFPPNFSCRFYLVFILGVYGVMENTSFFLLVSRFFFV
jgi:hypothetical protein